MTTSRFLLAFTLSLALVSTAAAAGGNVFIGNGLVAPGNEGPYGAELRGKCLMHWTAACDEAFNVRDRAREPILPNGEGLPLPWPFPWRAGAGGTDLNGI
jgi:hypothetical protein